MIGFTIIHYTFCQITFGKTRSDIYIQEKQNFLRYNNRNKNTIIPSVICEDSLVLSVREFYTSNIKFLDDMTVYLHRLVSVWNLNQTSNRLQINRLNSDFHQTRTLVTPGYLLGLKWRFGKGFVLGFCQ